MVTPTARPPSSPEPPSRANRFFLTRVVPWVLVGVGAAAVLSASPTASIPALNAVAAIAPTNPDVFYRIGLLAQRSGRWPEALDAYARAATLDMDSERNSVAWAGAAAALGQQKLAFNVLSTFVKSHPRSGVAHLSLAVLFQKSNSHANALSEALLATKYAPSDAEAWRVFGMEAETWHRLPEAEAAMRKAVSLDPESWEDRLSLAEVLISGNKQDEALACLQQTARRYPREALVLLALGRLQMQRNDLAAAQSSLTASLALRQDVPLTHLCLGQLHAQAGRWADARRELTTAQRLAPKNPEAAYALWRTEQRLGNTGEAARQLALHRSLLDYQIQAARLDERLMDNGRDAQARLRLARLCAAHGDYARAGDEYAQLVAAEPDATGPREEMEALLRLHGAEAVRPVQLPDP